MVDVFFTVQRMSGCGVVAALVMMTLMLILRRARVSKTALLLLWLPVALRLVCPWSPPSPLSLFNWGVAEKSAYSFSRVETAYVGDFKVGIQFPDGLGTEDFDKAVEAGARPEFNESIQLPVAYYYENSMGNITPAKTFRDAYGQTLAAVWLAGMGVFLAWGGLSYYLLRRKLRFAVKDEELPGVWYSDRIPSPCVAGLFRPQVYLTFNMTDAEREYVLAHERQHIRNGDHIWKVLGWLVLCVHWFDVVLWPVYRAFLWTLEDACDQRTLRELGEDRKADYGQALLSLSTGKRSFSGFTPLAFGEGDTKERVKTVLKYKKPLVWITALALLIGAALGVTVLTSRAERPEPASIEELYGDWTASGVVYLTPFSSSTADYELARLADRTAAIAPDRFSFNGNVLAGVTYAPIELSDPNAITVSGMGGDEPGGLFGPLDVTGKTARGWRVLDGAGNDTGWHIYSVAGRLWVGRWVFHTSAAKPYGEYWTIWEAVRGGGAGTADSSLTGTEVLWDYQPTLNSRLPFFPILFALTGEYDTLEVTCQKGALYLFETDPASSIYVPGQGTGNIRQAPDNSCIMPAAAGAAVLWAPSSPDGLVLAVGEDELVFTAYRGTEKTASGAVSIRRTDAVPSSLSGILYAFTASPGGGAFRFGPNEFEEHAGQFCGSAVISGEVRRPVN